MFNFNKQKLLNLWFQARIFISFSIVIFVCGFSFIFFPDLKPLYIIISEAAGVPNYNIFFLLAAFFLLVLSVLRMWAGSLLSSKTVMSFNIKTDSLITEGPYKLVRNPIYLADLLAMCTFSLFMPFTGLLLPLFFYLHYRQLILFEEKSFFCEKFNQYPQYLNRVPRLFPAFNGLFEFITGPQKIFFNRDGFRHNALYVLFIPGFIAGYFTHSFLYTVLIGLPAVIDWAVIHTKIGLPARYSIRPKPEKVFNSVLYSQCWEDPDIDRKAFKIIEDDIVFSITSGGCNILTFLIDNPASVIAVDMNPNQNYLLELKAAAFKHLNYSQMLEFFGVRKTIKRPVYFNFLRNFLSPEARLFWGKNISLIKKGIIHSGRYEHYMKLLRTCLYLLIGKSTIKMLFMTEKISDRKTIFENKWNNRRWRLFCKILLSRRTMSVLFTKNFFKYLPEKKESFGKHFGEKVKRALTILPLKENYFLTYILSGNYNEKHLPYYLRKENYEIIRSRIDRIRIVSGSCNEFFKTLPDDSISKFNFTNIFEWVSEEAFEALLKETIRAAKNNAVITYRNLLVPRQHPKSLSGNIAANTELSKKLHDTDLSFIYNNYVVERIIKLPFGKEVNNVLQSH